VAVYNFESTAEFHPDGDRILTKLSRSDVSEWRVRDGSRIRRLEPSEDLVLVARYTPDGDRIVTSSMVVPESGRAKLGRRVQRTDVWDATTGERLRVLEGGTMIGRESSFSPDGRSILVGLTEREVRVLDLESGRVRTTLRGHTGDVKACAWSPDGRLVATCALDGSTRVWDVATGREILSLESARQTPAPPWFGRDSRSLLWWVGDGSIWQVPLDPLDAARANLPRALTDAEKERYGIAGD
jgi:WD40 repeat protein